MIDEIFPNPTSSVGLPNAEFIELKNVSSTSFNLLNWQISDGKSTATIRTAYNLKPDSFLVICPNSAAALYTRFGPSMGVTGFPSLNNNGDTLYLKSPEGLTVHVVAYNLDSYQNHIKSGGGWSLEMIDTKNPCEGSANWKASSSEIGGTPGQKNAVDGVHKDETAPQLLRTYTIDSLTIVAVFNEPLDSANASHVGHYSIDNGVQNPLAAIPKPPFFNEVILQLPKSIVKNTVYQLIASGIADCSGNKNITNSVRAGLPEIATNNDIVINEILFNPKPNGYDYVELYNRSQKLIDLNKLYIANRDAIGNLKSIFQLTKTPLLFFPGDYYVITENKWWLQQNYLVKNLDNLLQISSLPSFPDEEGIAVLLNPDETVVDELHYNHKWHFPLIGQEDGIALERIDYNKPTQDPNNWTSAASTEGYGTPTYQNSEFNVGLQLKGEITVSPKIFSPDNDGYDDFCLISYQVPNAGYVGNITVYDASGRAVKNIANNATLGLSGAFKWDGLDDKQQKLPLGVYVIVTKIFDLSGKTNEFKNVVSLARKL